ncbi:hypothetical protein B0J11DRAFT_176270 [Dendryphion nanum]|uniref:F-box domain-containing protein n=1 Tax=Dendryphion nanum TaxID=256645 RepID=A0A9P9EG62_9PLEO|nr:hypothetical protein B0J11DRAFT_176270 [Dendryphion nanum]
MPGFLDLPIELRQYVYSYLLLEEIDQRSRAVMLVSEKYVKEHLPLRAYRGLLQTCNQLHSEFKEAIRHLTASRKLEYEFNILFSHGRPYFSLTWLRFPGLSPMINHIVINLDLRVREPFAEARFTSIPHHRALVHLLEDNPSNFASQLFDYIAILLKTLAGLMSGGDLSVRMLYTETMTVNLRRPTQMISTLYGSETRSRRVHVDLEESQRLDEIMRTTLKTNAKAFGAFDASDCDKLSPLIQIGSLRFATEGVVWGEGNNLVLAKENFGWLKYGAST